MFRDRKILIFLIPPNFEQNDQTVSILHRQFKDNDWIGVQEKAANHKDLVRVLPAVVGTVVTGAAVK